MFSDACERRDSQPGLNSLQFLRHRGRDHELVVIRRQDADIFAADTREHVLCKFHQHGERNAFIELQCETPSSRVIFARSFISLGMAMVHLDGHCCPKSGLQGVPLSQCSLKRK